MNPNETVIPQIRTYTRYRMGSVVMFNCAESPMKTISEGDSVQTGSQGSFLRLLALSYGMTDSVEDIIKSKYV